MNPFHQSQRLTRTVRKARKKQLQVHHRIETTLKRQRRRNTKKRSHTLTRAASKARTKKQKVAALRSELLAAYRVTVANIRKVQAGTTAAFKKIQPQVEAIEKMAAQLAELDETATDHSPPAANLESGADYINDQFKELAEEWDMALIATRDE